MADDYRPPKAKDAAAHRMKVCAQPKRAWPRRRVALRGLKLKQKYRNSCNSQPEKPAGLKPDAVNPVWKLYEPEAASAYRSESVARHPLWPSLLCLVRLRPPEAPPILRCLLLLPRSTRAPYSNESPLVPRVALPPPKCDVREFLCVFRHRSCESPAVPAGPRRQYTMLGRQRNVWGSPPSMVPPPRNKGTGQFGPCLATPSKW